MGEEPEMGIRLFHLHTFVDLILHAMLTSDHGVPSASLLLLRPALFLVSGDVHRYS